MCLQFTILKTNLYSSQTYCSSAFLVLAKDVMSSSTLAESLRITVFAFHFSFPPTSTGHQILFFSQVSFAIHPFFPMPVPQFKPSSCLIWILPVKDLNIPLLKHVSASPLPAELRQMHSRAPGCHTLTSTAHRASSLTIFTHLPLPATPQGG